jgi:hypothetical protein
MQQLSGCVSRPPDFVGTPTIFFSPIRPKAILYKTPKNILFKMLNHHLPLACLRRRRSQKTNSFQQFQLFQQILSFPSILPKPILQ